MEPARLIADTRERAVLRHERELAGTPVEVIQITTGDYVVVRDEQVLAVIERKSLEDYAASLKDGRHNNKEKLLRLRDQTGCAVIYIIEGPAFPSPTDCFGNIPYRHIQSSIFHLMVRDGITVLRTKDTVNTASTLAAFVASMNTISDCTRTPTGGDIDPDLRLLLTAKHPRDDHDIVREMWSCFPGITAISADEFIRAWSIADAFRGIPRDRLEVFKLANGRKLGKKAVSGLTTLDRLVQVRVIAAIPMVSKQVAVDLLNGRTLHELVSLGEKIADIPVGKTRRAFGREKAERLLRLCNYKYVKTEPDDIFEFINSL